MKFVLGGLTVIALALILTGVPYLFPAEWWLAATTATTAMADISLTLGALLAALAFGRGDPLRRAWLWVTASGFTGLVSTLSQGPNLRSVSNHLIETQSGLVVGGVIDVVLNLTMIIGFLLFARAWAQTGLAPPGQRAATLVATCVGLAVAGPSLWHDIVRALEGTKGGIGSSISDIGDIVAIALAGPLFASALWMRGGDLVGPYIYLTTSVAAWLVYDAGSLFALEGSRNFFDMLTTTTATLFAALAGLTHYWVIRKAPQRR